MVVYDYLLLRDDVVHLSHGLGYGTNYEIKVSRTTRCGVRTTSRVAMGERHGTTGSVRACEGTHYVDRGYPRLRIDHCSHGRLRLLPQARGRESQTTRFRDKNFESAFTTCELDTLKLEEVVGLPE